MTKLLPILFAAVLSGIAFAQDEGPMPKPSAASRRYHDYRLVATEPSYGLAKVKAMIRKIKEDPDMNRRLSDKTFSSLSFDEKFTYSMMHAEDFSQNCEMMMPIEEEHTKIFAFIPGAFGGEQSWSEKQLTFLKKNRSKVIGLLRSTIRSHKRVGLNLKAAIWQLNATELIPDLATAFNRDTRDNDILTLMMLMMNEAKYKPFLDSTSYKKLYADESTSYKAYLTSNSANKQLILARAGAFYHSKFK
jgi:hypothetical protein